MVSKEHFDEASWQGQLRVKGTNRITASQGLAAESAEFRVVEDALCAPLEAINLFI